MKAKEYPVLARAVEDGVADGYRRAHKHTGNPVPGTVINEIEQAVLGAICAVFEIAVEDGVADGYRRAHKHTGNPVPGTVINEIKQAVLGAICAVFEIDPDSEAV
jgi:hypothetical protein